VAQAPERSEDKTLATSKSKIDSSECIETSQNFRDGSLDLVCRTPILEGPGIDISPQPSCLSGAPRVRGTKRGYKNFSSPMKCGICSQGPPVWLWSLRPKEWSDVFVIRNEWELIRSQHPALWEQYRNVFKVWDPPLGAFDGSHDAIAWWISGTMEFIDGLSLPSGIPQILWLSKPGRQWPKSKTQSSGNRSPILMWEGLPRPGEHLELGTSISDLNFPRNFNGVWHMWSNSPFVPRLVLQAQRPLTTPWMIGCQFL
jgi:hypothetical protein